MTLAVYQPDGTVLFNYARPSIADNSAFNAGGMQFEVVEPFKHLRVRYDGTAVFLAAAARAGGSEAGLHLESAPPGAAGARLLRPQPDVRRRGRLRRLADMVFAKGHTEQHVKAAGRISIDGTAHRHSTRSACAITRGDRARGSRPSSIAG